MNEEKKIVEKAITELEAKVNTTDSIEELRFTPKDILLKRDIDFINKIKLDKEYQARTRTWKDYTREEQAELIMKYVDDIELSLVGTEIVVNQINFRKSICKPCQELFDKGYIDTTKPAIFGNVLGSVRFSNYLSEEEFGEIILRLQQYYDVHFTEVTYYVQNQMFYFNFVEDNSVIVRVFPLEDYYKLDPDNKMETYKFGIIYINEEDKFRMKEIDTAFDYIPDETNDIVNDVKQVYLDEFESARIEYNAKQNRDDRKIKNYFKKVCDSQNDIACEIIIELGDMGFWNNKDNEYRLKMVDVYNEQVKALIKIVPTFKVANATIHFDETSPHMHIVGVPIIENCTRGMKKQVGKTKLFTKTSLTEIQDKMRNACIRSYNKFYEVNTKLKEKQKGRNQDINVNEMGNYREIKKQLKQKEQKLEKANNQTKILDNSNNDIKEILNNLKSTKLNKNNMVISNEDVQKIKNYTEDVKEYNSDSKKCK